MIALWASYQFRLATPSYERLCRVEGRAGNHIITFAKGKIITVAKQAHNCKLCTKRLEHCTVIIFIQNTGFIKFRQFLYYSEILCYNDSGLIHSKTRRSKYE